MTFLLYKKFNINLIIVAVITHQMKLKPQATESNNATPVALVNK